jgi:hypothetical protein
MPQHPWLEEQISALPDAQLVAPSGEEPLVEPLVEYVVVDELEEDVAVLLVEPWPIVDDRGRLRFQRPDQRVSVDAYVDSFQRLLMNRVPAGELRDEQRTTFAARPLRVGDVFCAVIDRAALANTPDKWLRLPVIDVTAEARDAAKAQYFAAVGPVLRPEQLEALVDGFQTEDEGG